MLEGATKRYELEARARVLTRGKREACLADSVLVKASRFVDSPADRCIDNIIL